MEYHFTVTPKESGTEILIAQLGFAGFESFVETEEGVTAYIQKQEWNETILEDVFVLYSDEFSIKYDFKEVAQTNWNAEWEKNFEPIQVDEAVSIRAPFHENPHLKYDIVIEPKMSFGTGHHETTHMMVQHLLQIDLEDKKVLDMGCGTGILAIFAEMKGAKPTDAIDIDTWCYENSIENVARNNCNRILGSSQLYIISTMILIIIKRVAITKTLPIIIGKSNVFNASTISFPNPFQLKIYSTKTAPANMDANHPEIAVTTGFKEFFNACFFNTWYIVSPFALAVLT
jgi:ribosomal protein L11 methylase PrmA